MIHPDPGDEKNMTRVTGANYTAHIPSEGQNATIKMCNMPCVVNFLARKQDAI